METGEEGKGKGMGLAIEFKVTKRYQQESDIPLGEMGAIQLT
jgi:hypothetical protein